MLKPVRAWVALVLALALLATACGSSTDDLVDAASDAADSAIDTASDTASDAADAISDDEADDEAAADDEAMADDEAAADDEAMTDDEAAAGSLLIWADEQRAEPLQEVAGAFTEATGVDVTVELVVFDELRDRVNQAAPAGEGPDIFVGAHDWTGELAANGVITPVDVSATSSNYLSSALAAFNFAGENYAVPYVTEAVAMYYNTDLISEVPTSFDDIAAACIAAAVENCVVVPGGGGGADAYHNYPFVSAFGGGIFAFDTSTGFDASQVLLDSPETVKGIEYLEGLVADGVVASTDYGAAQTLFLEGSAAFWITGPWELSNMREQSDVNFDVALIPQIGDAPAQPFVGSQGFFLSAFSENELLATSFLLDFVATDDTMQELYDADPRGTAWAGVQSALADDPQAQTFAASAGNGIPMPNIPQMGSVWGPLGDNLLLVRNGEAPGADAMTTAAEAVRAAIAG